MEIRARNLSCARGQRTVLSGLSLTLGAGDCLILRGPNGSGKTTLLRSLAGLSPLRAGRLRIDPDAVAFSGHLDAVKPQLSVAENLIFWDAVFGAGQAEAALARFDLGPLRDRPAAFLSAGQKRRLGLARLCLSGRPIWLMDEPTTALDRDNSRLVEEILTEHCSGGGLAVVSTHLDLDVPGARVLELPPPAPAAASGTTAPGLTSADEDPFLAGDF